VDIKQQMIIFDFIFVMLYEVINEFPMLPHESFRVANQSIPPTIFFFYFPRDKIAREQRLFKPSTTILF
jgi:hypothetical protein